MINIDRLTTDIHTSADATIFDLSLGDVFELPLEAGDWREITRVTDFLSSLGDLAAKLDVVISETSASFTLAE